MDTCEVITGMIEVINKQGWCQNELRDDAGRVCIRGALYQTLTGDAIKFPANWPVQEKAEGAIGAQLPQEHQGHSIVTFNNHPDTTKEDVLDVLYKTKEAVC